MQPTKEHRLVKFKAKIQYTSLILYQNVINLLILDKIHSEQIYVRRVIARIHNKDVIK